MKTKGYTGLSIRIFSLTINYQNVAHPITKCTMPSPILPFAYLHFPSLQRQHQPTPNPSRIHTSPIFHSNLIPTSILFPPAPSRHSFSTPLHRLSTPYSDHISTPPAPPNTRHRTRTTLMQGPRELQPPVHRWVDVVRGREGCVSTARGEAGRRTDWVRGTEGKGIGSV